MASICTWFKSLSCFAACCARVAHSLAKVRWSSVALTIYIYIAVCGLLWLTQPIDAALCLYAIVMIELANYLAHLGKPKMALPLTHPSVFLFQYIFLLNKSNTRGVSYILPDSHSLFFNLLSLRFTFCLVFIYLFTSIQILSFYYLGKKRIKQAGEQDAEHSAADSELKI